MEKKGTFSDLLARVASWGYIVVPHTVTTPDNYIITVFHILPKDEGKKRNPILIQHGIKSCGSAFLANRQGLAYLLQDKGYDVWVGNARGTQFSRKHKFYGTDSAEYWNFSFHEMGMNDIPAVLQYIKKDSGRPKVHFIGHSMGTTMFLVMASEMPQILDIVDTIILMAPVAHLNPIPFLPYCVTSCLAYLAMNILPDVGCPRHTLEKIVGNKENIEEEIDVGTSVESNGWQAIQCFIDFTSWKTPQHYLQIIESGTFQWFHCNEDSPVLHYNINNIRKRVYILSGGQDFVSNPQDVQWLASRLPQPWLIKQGFELFDHSAFNVGMGMKQVLHTADCIFNAAEEGQDPAVPRDEVSYEGEKMDFMRQMLTDYVRFVDDLKSFFFRQSFTTLRHEKLRKTEHKIVC